MLPLETLLSASAIIILAWSAFVWIGANAAQKEFGIPNEWGAYWLGILGLTLLPSFIGLLWVFFSLTDWFAIGVAKPAGENPALGALILGLKEGAELGEISFWHLPALAGLGIYVVVLTILLLRGLKQLFRVHGIVSQAIPVSDGLTRQVGLGVGVRLLISEDVHTAFAHGGSRPEIILPRSFVDRLSEEQVKLIIAHEHAHIRRRDPEIHMVLGMIEGLFWFSPFVRFMSNRAQLAAEFACDRAALGPNPASYARTYARTYLEALRLEAAFLRN
jgi:Zn-dependent protease with chaperone function